MPRLTQNGVRQMSRVNWTSLHARDAFWQVVLACLNVVFFAEVLFTGRTFFVRDVSTFHYPLKKLVTEAYARGEWPLWNPYIQMGQPLLANPNCMAFYPGQLLFQILPFETAFELHFVLHCILAGVGAFRLARTLGLSLQAAFLSAVIYNFSGLTLSAVNLFNILPVVAFLPWLSVASLWLVSRPSVVRGCVTSALLGTFFLLLEPLSTLATVLFLCVLVGGFVWQSGQLRSSWLRLSRIAVIVVLAALSIAAIQIVPTLELVQLSGRKGGLSFSEATFWSLHPVQLLQALCPKILGEYFRLEAPVPWPARFFDQREPYLLSCYVGGLALLLAAWGAWQSRSHWRTRSLLVAMVASTLLALGLHTPLYSALFDWIPVFRYGRFPVKFLFAANLGLALLAGTGWASLQGLEDTSRSLRFLRRVMIVLLVLSMALAALYGRSAWTLLGVTRTPAGEFVWGGSAPVQVGANLVLNGLRHIHLHLGIFVTILLLRTWSPLRPGLLGVSMILVVLIDLWSGNIWINPPGDSRLYETAPIAQYLQEREKADGPFRIYRFEPSRLSEHPSIRYETDSVIWISLYRKLTLFPFLAAKDHIAYSVFPSVDRLDTPFVQQLGRTVEKSRLEERIDLLSGLNVRYIVSPVELVNARLTVEALFQVNSDQPLRLYAVEPFAPRAFVGSMPPAQIAGTRHPAANSRPSMQENGSNLADVVPWIAPLERASAKISKYSGNYVNLEVEAVQGGLLVLMDNSYPGWVARVDAEVRPIESMHPVYRAVAVSAGKHQVTFSYEPPSFRLGLIVSASGILLVLATLAVTFVRRR